MCPSRNILKASKTKRIKKKKKKIRFGPFWVVTQWEGIISDSFGSIPAFALKGLSITPTTASDQRLLENKRNDGTDLLTHILYNHMTSNVCKIETPDRLEFYNRKWLLKERWYVAFSLFHQVQLWATNCSYIDTEVSSNHNLSIQLSPDSWGAHPWDCQPLRDGFSPGKTGALASRAKTEVEGATGAGKTHPASINLMPWEE